MFQSDKCYEGKNQQNRKGWTYQEFRGITMLNRMVQGGTKPTGTTQMRKITVRWSHSIVSGFSSLRPAPILSATSTFLEDSCLSSNLQLKAKSLPLEEQGPLHPSSRLSPLAATPLTSEHLSP